jgi:intermediate peptidase
MHELGHAIHSVLAQTDYQHVSGTRCKLDFVETPSILMEIIAKDQWSVERLRDVYVQKTVDMVGTASMRSPSRSTEAIDDPIERQQQIFLSILDQKYHGELVPHSFDSTAVYESVMVQHQVYPFNSCAQNQRSFNHLFNYGSIYYSYLWCRSLAYSIYRHLFWENFRSDNSSGIRRAGEIIYEEMLKYGGSKDPWSMNWERLRGGSPGLNRT